MAEKLAEARLVLSLDDKALREDLAKIPGVAQKVAKDVEQVKFFAQFQAFKEISGAVFSGLGAIAEGFAELGNRGAQVDDVAGSFEVLTQKTGETADVMLGALRQGVVGTLSDYDLMVLANKTLGSGLVKTSEDMGVLSAGARTLAKATGGTTKEAFDTLTSAIASGRTATLKQIGLFVDAKVATENWATAHKTTTSAMTDSDRAQALAAASLSALKQRMQDIVPDAADFGELIEQAKVRLENFKDQLSVAVAKSPVLAAGMNAMGAALGAAFGPSQGGLVGFVVKQIENVAIGITYAGQAVVGIGYAFATVFSAAKTLVLGVATVVSGFAVAVVGTVDAMAQLAAKLPFASDGTKQLAAMTGSARTQVDAFTKSLAESTKEAALGVIGQSDLHNKLIGVSTQFMYVRDSMNNAKASTDETKKAVVALGDAAPPAAARNQDMADKVAEAFRVLNDEIALGTKTGLDRRLEEINQAKANELASVDKLKFDTIAKHDEMVRLVTEKYRQKTEAAIAAGDEVAAKERDVQNEIALLTTTGTANKLLQIQIAQDKEITSLATLKLANEQRYAEDVAAVNEKYRIMAEAAQGHYQTVELAAAAAGFKTREEMQQEADNARRLYDEMLSSGKYTYSELEKAKTKATEAEKALDETKTSNAKKNFGLIAEAASSMLRSLFGKSKAAAIAAALIDAAAAIVKGFAQGGIMGWVNAAVIGAATAAQINQIRNTQPEGFAKGTPNLDFADFGAVSFQPLHNQEAVIPRGGGHLLAGEIAASLPESGEQLSMLGRIASSLDELPGEMRRAFRNAMILDMA